MGQQIVSSTFHTSCKDSNLRQVTTTQITYFYITEQTRRGYRPRENRFFIDIALTKNKQTAFASRVIEKQNDVFIAVAVRVCHVETQVGHAYVTALVCKCTLAEAAERHTIEYGNRVSHIHHDFLYTVPSLVLDTFQIKGTGEILVSYIRH